MISIKNYKPGDKSVWTGRVDDREDTTTFRWHQVINELNLRDAETERFNGKLGIAFLGYACDEGIVRNKGVRGAALGPEIIRKKLSNLPCHFKSGVSLFDAGDVVCENSDLEATQEDLSKAVKKLLELNMFPLLLGGGHDIAFGHYKGITKYLHDKEKDKIGIINFDAHFDLRPHRDGGTSGTMFSQIAELTDNTHKDYSYLCIGIQKLGNTEYLFDKADELGVKYILARDLNRQDNTDYIDKIDSFIKKQDHIYLTVCADVFSSAYAPGVSAPQPFGLHPLTVLPLIEKIIETNKVISFDIAEISPRADINNLTAALASNIIYSVVASLNNL